MRKLLILGATSAIAQETARIFAADGAALFLVARHAERLDAVASDLAVRGAKIAGSFVCDLNSTDLHASIVKQASAALDGIDVVLIAHGVYGDQQLPQHDFALADTMLRTNFLSVVSLLTAIADYMEARRSGTIAVISSVAGDRGRQSNYVYGASKAALSAYLQGVRNRLYPAGVHVLTIKPGFVDTPMTAHVRKSLLFASPAAVARSIHRGIRRRRDVIYTPAWWRWIMLIIRLVPEGIFKRLRL